jgi:hypothetical protein
MARKFYDHRFQPHLDRFDPCENTSKLAEDQCHECPSSKRNVVCKADFTVQAPGVLLLRPEFDGVTDPDVLSARFNRKLKKGAMPPRLNKKKPTTQPLEVDDSDVEIVVEKQSQPSSNAAPVGKRKRGTTAAKIPPNKKKPTTQPLEVDDSDVEIVVEKHAVGKDASSEHARLEKIFGEGGGNAMHRSFKLDWEVTLGGFNRYRLFGVIYHLGDISSTVIMSSALEVVTVLFTTTMEWLMKASARSLTLR